MKIKVAEAEGIALDWMVAKAENRLGLTGLDQAFGVIVVGSFLYTRNNDGEREWWAPSTDWSQGGPIIEREKIDVEHDMPDGWLATKYMRDEYAHQCGPTPLIAAMRCYVASRLGDEIDVPEELT